MQIQFSSLIPEVANSRIEEQKSFLKEFISSNSRSDFLRDVHQDRFAHILKEKFQDKKYFVHVGFGGSSLGTEAIIDALDDQQNIKYHFFNNIDADHIQSILDEIDIKETLFYVVSKSGGTHETLVLISLIDKLLKKELGEKYQRKNYLAACTEDESFLSELAQKWDIPTLKFPETLGGRFSVLSNVSYFPLAFSNISEENFKFAQENFLKDLEFEKGDQLAKLSIALFDLYQKGFNQTVIMPYSSKLRSFSDWFVQLWAESLGKDGFGFSPLVCYGSTGQHSQLQLFMQGPKNKFMIFLEVENSKSDFSISDNLGNTKLNNSTKISVQTIINAHLAGTRNALTQEGVPNITLKLPILDESNLCELFLFFQVLTVLTGNLAKLDTFNQPGVELSKKLCLEELKKING